MLGLGSSISTSSASREITVNGNFGTGADSDWTAGTGWTVAGEATSDGTTSNLDQIVLESGKEYKVTIKVKNRTTGTLSVRFGGDSDDQALLVNSNGTKFSSKKVAGGTTLRLRSQSSFDGTIEYISVTEV
jgi:hypothetical protein|tara:strand:+ start:46 stop:438 length:393 start_codon:yes stop_codon:yes gene_type:complete